MLKAEKKTKLTSASAKCSKKMRKAQCIFLFLIIHCALLILNCLPCCAMNVSGIPSWLEPAVKRSLNAIWTEIPREPGIDREGTLALVASRLFAGYDVKIESKRDGPAVFFIAVEKKIIPPEIKINIPELRGLALNWFESDTQGISRDIFELVEKLPPEAFTWADEALRERVGLIINERLPGWEFSQQIYISESSTVINLNFRPSSKMILAVQPSLYSHTIPVMFRTDLQAKLIPALSPLIGVPVKWAARHKDDIEKFAQAFLEDRHTVENLKADVNIKFLPDTVSNLEARVDSHDFLFQLWVAAYAGLRERYPELGAFFGFRPDIWLRPEIYAETIFALDNFGLTFRLGTQIELVENFWIGIENQWPENEYFFRFQYSPLRVRRPYALWRYSPGLATHEAAIGYRIDEHMSLEIYYNNSGDDKWGLRGMWNL